MYTIVVQSNYFILNPFKIFFVFIPEISSLEISALVGLQGKRYPGSEERSLGPSLQKKGKAQTGKSGEQALTGPSLVNENLASPGSGPASRANTYYLSFVASFSYHVTLNTCFQRPYLPATYIIGQRPNTCRNHNLKALKWPFW